MGTRAVSVVLSAALIPILPALPAQAETDHLDTAVAQLPGIVEQTMAATGVPGVAVGVVHGDKLIYSQGFGVRNAKGEPVTPETVFQVASVSKSVGASAVAAAIGKGGVRWDDPVVKHMPSFALQDKWVSRHVTIGDLYAHRSGLPGNTGNDLETFGVPISKITHRMRYVPLSPLRNTYAYSNFGLTVAGRAVAESRDQSWPKMTKQLLLKPLGMSSSSFRHSDFVKQPNRAQLHQQEDGRWIVSQRDPDAQAPAGGLSSTVGDMAKWLRMQLANGMFEGQRVVAKNPLFDSRSLQIRSSAPNPDDTDIVGYGFGTGVTKDNVGNMKWSHSGAFSAGAATRYVILPAYDTAIVVLTNGWPVGVPEAIAESFADLVETGTVTQDWLAYYKQVTASFTTPNRTAFDKPKPADPRPAMPLKTYVGRYQGDYTGPVEVRRKGGRLVLDVGNVSLPLRHWTGNIYAYDILAMPKGFIAGVKFKVKGSKAVSVNLQEVSYDLGELGIARR